MKSLCASAQLAACARLLLYLTPFGCSYIDDGFVTIGTFLDKTKADFQRMGKGDIKVVQGESIPASMAGNTVLCIHNLTPVKKVDPTWAVRRPARAAAQARVACLMRACSCRSRCRNTRSFTMSSRTWRGAGLRRATSPSSACDGERPRRPHWHSHACCSRTRSFTYKTQRALPGALLRSAIVTHATVMLELSPALKQAQV